MAVDIFSPPQFSLLLIATIELCSGFVLINSSLTVLFRSKEDWHRKTFAVSLISGLFFLALVVFQIFGVITFNTLQPGTALLFAFYSLFAFMVSWNLHKTLNQGGDAPKIALG